MPITWKVKMYHRTGETNEDLYAILYHTISGHSYRRISRDLLSMATIWR